MSSHGADSLRLSPSPSHGARAWPRPGPSDSESSGLGQMAGPASGPSRPDSESNIHGVRLGLGGPGCHAPAVCTAGWAGFKFTTTAAPTRSVHTSSTRVRRRVTVDPTVPTRESPVPSLSEDATDPD